MVDIVPVSELYDGLSASQITLVQAAEKEIQISSRIAIRAMIAIGKRLAAVKPILKGEDKWRRWLKQSFDASHDTADRYIQVAEKFGDLSQIASFQKGALYLLSEDEVPQEARDLAIQRAERGEHITRQVAAEIAKTFQAAAVNVVKEALITQGSLSIDGKSVAIVESVDEDGHAVLTEKSLALIDAAVAQGAAEQIKFDKETVAQHIEKRDRHLRRKVFLKVGGLDEFQKVMRSKERKTFKGKLYISLWGIPEEANDSRNSSGTVNHDHQD